MRARAVVVPQVAAKVPTEVILVHDDHVVEELERRQQPSPEEFEKEIEEARKRCRVPGSGVSSRDE